MSVEILAAGDARSRERAALSLGRIRSAASVDGLIASLGDEYHRVRIAALLALGDIGDARCLPAVEPLLESPNWRVCGSAIYTPRGLPDPRAHELAAGALARSDRKLHRGPRITTRRRRWYLRAKRAKAPATSPASPG